MYTCRADNRYWMISEVSGHVSQIGCLMSCWRDVEFRWMIDKRTKPPRQTAARRNVESLTGCHKANAVPQVTPYPILHLPEIACESTENSGRYGPYW